MRVDLPAPFSPQIAWISPSSTERLTLLSAFTGPKLFSISRISRITPADAVAIRSSAVLYGAVDFVPAVACIGFLACYAAGRVRSPGDNDPSTRPTVDHSLLQSACRRTYSVAWLRLSPRNL